MTDSPQKRSPFAVDEDNALAALDLAWGDLYEFAIVEDQWQAYPDGAPVGDMLSGATPDDLNRAVRDDWARRHGAERGRGPSGMPPS